MKKVSSATFESYWKSRSVIERNQLVVSNRGLARKISIDISKCTFVELDELRQVADQALIQCVEKFDPTMGYRFSSFAVPILRGRLLNYVRDKGHSIRIPRKYYDLVQKVKSSERKLAGYMGRLPTDKEQALSMGIEIDEFREAKRSIRSCRFISPEENIANVAYSDTGSCFTSLKLKIDYSKLSALQKASIELYFNLGVDAAKSSQMLNYSNFKDLLESAISKISIVSG